jgi:hypothetical protein
VCLSLFFLSDTRTNTERALTVERYNPAVVSFDALKALTGSHHATLVEVLKAHAQDHNTVPLRHNPARAIFTVKLGQAVEGIIVLSRSKATQEENAALQVTFDALAAVHTLLVRQARCECVCGVVSST